MAKDYSYSPTENNFKNTMTTIYKSISKIKMTKKLSEVVQSPTLLKVNSRKNIH